MYRSVYQPVDELKDDSIIKINKSFEEEFIKDIRDY